MKDVTILVISYKQDVYIPRAMQSALDQVSPYLFEEQPLLMPSFEVKLWRDTKGIGASHARNIAVATQVDTPWVIILDADDVLPSHYLWYMWQYKDYSIAKKVFVGPVVQFISGVRMDRLYFEGAHSNCDFRKYCPCCTISALFPIQAFNAINGFDINMKTLNDWDFFIRLTAAGYTYVHCKDTFIMRSSIPNSITNKGRLKPEEVLAAFNTKHGTTLTNYPQPYTIPDREF